MPRWETHEPGRPSREDSEHVRNYLEMTAPRIRRPVEPERATRERRRPIDNEGLALDEGNDFA